jgi:GT2 family glycosyltransferase
MEENASCGFAAGRILRFDDRDLAVTIQESKERVEFKPFTFMPTGHVHGANMAFRRSALERIGGFDTRLGAGSPIPSGEDIDALAAVLWAGFAGIYDPRAVVYHDHGRRSGDDLSRLMHAYDVGRGAYYAKNVLKSGPRVTYLRAWGRSIGRDCIHTLPRGKLPSQSIREILGGLRYANSSPTRDGQ